MRSEKEMMDLIMGTAEEDERIRAVILNGSRANPNVQKDCFQDYDIVYVVRDIKSFTSDHTWVDRFGERIIMQMPEDMVVPPAENNGRFAYLMLFTDGNRIDLTLVPVEKAKELIDRDSLSILLLDKDQMIDPFPPPTDSDYVVKPPTAKEFANCCNEFWWVSTYVAKALWREEISHAKFIQEVPVRNMLMRMLEWQIGVKTGFTISTGKSGKYFKDYLENETWRQFLKTYPDADCERIWEALFTMCDLFRTVAADVAEHFGFEYPEMDDGRVTAHLHHVRSLTGDAKEVY
ncbi:MAG TPA: aminoglycoside 6-adenylyltransferase [Bacillales bacterium]|nr:aminoglycoside 6-adenylyltransferase [Bacillales bacterium]